MTEKELSQLYFLNREVERLQRDIDDKESSIGYKSPKLSDMPKGGMRKDYTDQVAEVADLKTIQAVNLRRIQRERARLEEYIGSIEDAEIRLIVRLRHVNGMTWRAIGAELGYEGYNIEGTPRKKYKRYMLKVSDTSD